MGIVNGSGESEQVKLIKNIFSRINLRIILVMAAVVLLGAGLMYRLFILQIVNGESYMNNFQLRIRREISIPASRGNIYDRNGNLLAYNELAYAVTLRDVGESSSTHDHDLNQTIRKAIDIIEGNGDQVTTNFSIELDSNGNFQYTVEGMTLQRFLADVYGHAAISELEEEEAAKTADQVMEDLAKRYNIGQYENVDSDLRSDAISAGAETPVFVPGKGYEPKVLLQMITIRYLLGLNSYQRYVSTRIAVNVSSETVAAILENTDNMEGIDIEDATQRRYVDSKYFAQILGYTGQINTDELQTLQETNPSYISSDVVGKSGIEKSMEAELQGKKGTRTVYVDNLGKELETTNIVQPTAGNNVYLTIDKDLQEAAYDILEKELSNIILSKLQNIKEFTLAEDESTYKIVIPIYDVYYAVFRNNIISLDHLASAEAKETEKAVHDAFLNYSAGVYTTIRDQMTSTLTPYQNLTKEYKDYQSYIIQKLYTDGVIDRSKVDEDDATYIAWTKDETISMAEYLQYTIAMNWVDVSKMNLDEEYSSSAQVYQSMTDYIVDMLEKDKEFTKHIYHFMIQSDTISGTQVCEVLVEQGAVSVSDTEWGNLVSGGITAFTFMENRIRNLDLTPAQLNLDPYSGSIVLTDVNTGDVLAMVSYPSFDNNRMANGVDPVYYEQLRNDNSHPLINYATQQRTAPGSTFKPVSATAGLMEGVIRTDSNITCTGVFSKIGEPEPHCWIYPQAHGTLNVTGGIHNSCNDYFYEVGYRLGLIPKEGESVLSFNFSPLEGEANLQQQNFRYDSDIGISKLTKYAQMYGLGDKSGVEIEEASPLISTEDAVRSAIGQGNSNYTTVGIARYVTTLANNGTCYDLTLISKIENAGGDTIRDNRAETRNVINMDQSYWDAIHEGMRKVVEGMSFYVGFPIDVAGKTGTAQETADRPDHALFVGYAPYETPQIAVATRIANGYTSTFAAQITQQVLRYYFGLAGKNQILSEESHISSTIITGD